ncbi:MAG: hypothetical protein ACYDD4_11435 [Acidimicrobiales bacterium]
MKVRTLPPRPRGVSGAVARPRALDEQPGDGAPARVLVVGTDDWAVEQTAPMLEASGCEVLRCHEPGEPAFPCNALIEGRQCPLDVGFDVVVNVRARAIATLAPGEFGAVCALHNGMPLVVAGIGYEHPLDGWTASVVERGGDVASAVLAAAAARSSS